MRVKGSPEEIWRYINLLYECREAVNESVERQIEDAKRKKNELLSEKRSKTARVLADNIEEQIHNLEIQKGRFETDIEKTIRKIHRFLLYLESIGTGMKSSSGAGGQYAQSAGAHSSISGTIMFRGIAFRSTDSFEVTDDNIWRMEQGHTPVGKDGLYVNLHHSLQTEDGPIWEIQGSQHKKWHRALHINPNTMPSGINRKAFSMLKGDYWRYRAKLIKFGRS